MNGLGMLLKSFGIEIDPKEVTTTFERLKADIPAFAHSIDAKVQAVDDRLSRLETKIDQLLGDKESQLGGRTARDVQRINGPIAQ